MERSNNSMVFYESWYRALKKKTPDVYKEIVNAILEYGLYGEMPDKLSDEAEDVFILAEPNLTANLERRENGRKGGRPSKNHRLLDTKTIGYESEKPNVNVNVNANENVNANKDVNLSQRIVDLFNETCVSYPRVTRLSDKRDKAIKARLKKYTEEDFITLFKKAEGSDFLKGSNKSNWAATFDWLIADGNMAKVLDGNYDNRRKAGFEQREHNFSELESILIAN